MATRERQADGKAERGSERLMAERSFSEDQLRQLLRLSQRTAKLVYWFPRGQPVPDSIYGAVVLPVGKAGGFIDRLHRIEGLQLRLDVFPLGIPVPEELLVRFEQGFVGH